MTRGTAVPSVPSRKVEGTPERPGRRARGEGGRAIRFRRLESRLLASFLILAALPSLLLTLVATGAVRWAVDKIQSPSVEQSFGNSAALARELRGRLLREGSGLLAALPPRPPAPADEPAVRALLAGRGAAFAAWGLPDGSTSVLDVDVHVGGSDYPQLEDWRALAAAGRPAERRGDAVRFFAPADAGADARAVGFRVDLASAAALDSAGEDYTRYRQLFVMEAVWKRALLAALGGTFLVTAVAAYGAARVTARRIGRPVALLAESADRVAGGDLSHRVDVRADGEIGDLVHSFNRMTEQLERSREELLRMERIAAWRDVARRVAHEIRNPLTPIRLALHRLESRVGQEASARDCLGSIAEEIDNLERLSATFSEFAKLPEARLERVDLARIAAAVVELHREAAPGVRVEYDGPDALEVVGDRDLLRRAVTNLVKNAAEALVGRSGHVRVRVRKAAGRARLEVEDDGPGIPEDLVRSLARPGVSGKPGGSGLGLAMVQRIAADHRGTLAWRSGKDGTTFVLEMPADLPESPRPS
ncbi:MAG: ATP-binding protein [bacterium]